ARASELQATLAGGVGQRLDAAVVAVAGTVERDLLDTGCLGLLGDGAADLGGGIGVLAVLQAVAHVGLGGAGRGQHLRALGAEHLGVDALAGAQHRQARHAEFANVRARGLGAAQAGDFLVHGYALWRDADRLAGHRRGGRRAALRLLGFLADDDFVGVLHALALVGLRRSESADLGGNFADQLLVRAGDQDLGLRRRGDRDAFRRLDHDRVREAQRQVQVLALDSGAGADAGQRGLARETLGVAVHHVGDERAQRAGEGDLRGVVGREPRVAVLDPDFDAGRLDDRQRALRALDADRARLGVHFNALRQGDRLLGDAGHVRYSLRPRSTGLLRRRPAGAPANRS